MKKRFITINRHATYIKTLQQIGGTWTIIENFNGEDLKWSFPLNFETEETVAWNDDLIKKINQHKFDYFIVHTLADLWKLRRIKGVKLIFIAHIALYKHNLRFFVQAIVKRLLLQWICVLRDVKCVCVSEWKKDTWLCPQMTVIKTPPLPTTKVKCETVPKVIVIGNHLDSRKEIDFSIIEKISQQIPVQVVGKSHSIIGAIEATTREEFNKVIENFQIALFILQRPFEDGYNLGLLEAMQSGMAVVSLENPSSPIKNNINGFQCKNVEEMIEKIRYLQSNPKLCEEFGINSQKIVSEQFSTIQFVERWNLLIN